MATEESTSVVGTTNGTSSDKQNERNPKHRAQCQSAIYANPDCERNDLDPNPIYAHGHEDNQKPDSHAPNAGAANSGARGESGIKPCAVGYLKDGDNNGSAATTRDKDRAPSDGHIEPYAVAYVEHHDQTAKVSFRKTKGVTNLSDCSSSRIDADVSVGDIDVNSAQEPRHASKTMHQNTMSGQNAAAAVPNPRSGQNALLPNPIYVPNVHRQTACDCNYRRVCAIAAGAVVVLLLLTLGAFVGVYINNNLLNIQKPTPHEAPTHTPNRTPTPGHPACCSTEPTKMADLRAPSTRLRVAYHDALKIIMTQTRATSNSLFFVHPQRQEAKADPFLL
uniref:Uncharacterized protein n=1 Tax=Branchiostoma floridae TaxID=7739 RepID=C3YZI4_BRAFL|eukprot:XP_002598243.1 hypothetical protein BRAFLDRAFT_69576 [Branchiostoma floridae]